MVITRVLEGSAAAPPAPVPSMEPKRSEANWSKAICWPEPVSFVSNTNSLVILE